MEYRQTLIDNALKVCKSAYKLCAETGIDQGNMSKIRKGTRGLTFEQTVKLAAIVGIDPADAWYQVSMEQVKDGEERRDLLGKARATTVAAMLLIFVSLALLQPLQSYASEPTKGLDRLSFYTSWNVLRRRLRQVIGAALALWHSHCGTRTLALALR